MNAGAEAIIVICPACFQQMDSNQKKAGGVSGGTFGIPVLYLTELLALAMGVKPDEIGVRFHRSRLTALLEKYNLK